MRKLFTLAAATLMIVPAFAGTTIPVTVTVDNTSYVDAGSGTLSLDFTSGDASTTPNGTVIETGATTTIVANSNYLTHVAVTGVSALSVTGSTGITYSVAWGTAPDKTDDSLWGVDGSIPAKVESSATGSYSNTTLNVRGKASTTNGVYGTGAVSAQPAGSLTLTISAG
jgi:hypothetical protein